MSTKSYLDKTFTIDDPDARVRQDDLVQFVIFKAGDNLPPGKKVGDVKTIPVGTQVRVTDVKVGSNKKTFAFAEPVAPGDPFGWTSVTNFKGKFLNETTSEIPAKAELPFQGNNKTVTDEHALIRTGPPNFQPVPQGELIVQGAYVVVTETSGHFVKVSHGDVKDGQIVVGDEIGWTAASNLTNGWSDPFGPTAAWDHGNFIGQKDLVNIVGDKGDTEQVTKERLDVYLALAAAAAQAGIMLCIESGFRSYPDQKFLYVGYKQHRPGFNLAAPPGRSNHQHGQAFDLNTGGFDGDHVYDWLKQHAPALGFIRTVPGEHWHWEYRPDEVQSLHGGFRRPGVNP